MDTDDLFPGFTTQDIPTDGGVHIRVRSGGRGRPLLLLHGHPQTHAIWHKVAPRLAGHFTLVLADLRGYGGSSRPAGTADHGNYAKRVMARDMVRVMQALGHAHFDVLAHARAAWCCSTSPPRSPCTNRPTTPSRGRTGTGSS